MFEVFLLALFVQSLLCSAFELNSHSISSFSVNPTCSEKCTLEEEYWLRYNSEGGSKRNSPWPYSCYDGNSMNKTESNSFFGISTWLDLFKNRTSTSDACYTVGRSYIASKLNICNGACQDVYVNIALSELSRIFSTWCSDYEGLSSGGFIAKDSARNRTLELETTLLIFNNGTGSSDPCIWCDDEFTGLYSSSNCDLVATIECNSVIQNESCATLWGWTNNENHTVFISTESDNFKNFFYPNPKQRGQGSFFSVGNNKGKFSTIGSCSTQQLLTFNLANSNATAVPEQTCHNINRYEHDCDKNNVSDYCEIMYSESGNICEPSEADARCFLEALTADIGCAIINSGTSRDCNSNFIKDTCETTSNSQLPCTSNICHNIPFEIRPKECLSCYSADSNSNQIPDVCEDCNKNGISDINEIALGLVEDCDKNMEPDPCQIAANPDLDCNKDGKIDTCYHNNATEFDCNNNGIWDFCDAQNPTFFPSCYGDGSLDSCRLASGRDKDCNKNGRPDKCDIRDGIEDDCDGDGEPDSCQIKKDPSLDCNNDKILDVCTFLAFPMLDCNDNEILDECEPANDCNNNKVSDICDIKYGGFKDCDEDGRLDICQIADNPSLDCDNNGELDPCEFLLNPDLDCNKNRKKDSCEIEEDKKLDRDNNLELDSCQAKRDKTLDCDENLLLDEYEILDNPNLDLDKDGRLDKCQIAENPLLDCNNNSIIDWYESDTRMSSDCNLNEKSDYCDILDGTSEDLNEDWIPDECQRRGACCNQIECIDDSNYPICNSEMGVFFENTTCSRNTCSNITITPKEEYKNNIGSCCIDGVCNNDVQIDQCDNTKGKFSLSSCDVRTDCKLKLESSGENSPRSIALLVVGIVLSVLVICVFIIVAICLLKPKKQKNTEKKGKSKRKVATEKYD